MHSAQEPETVMSLKRKRIVACEECHRKKVKCSGNGPPCQLCDTAGSQCVYPVKDKKIKVDQHYIDALLEDNRRLSSVIATAQSSSSVTPTNERPSNDVIARSDDADRNPILGNQAWFVPVSTVDLPVHIGEAADAAFATRMRQAIAGRSIDHLPRTHYMSDNVIFEQEKASFEWPSASRVRFLVDVALKFISSRWHIVRRSVVLADMEKLIRQPSSCDRVLQCQMLALLALGEAMSNRCVLTGSVFPGLKPWCRAMTLLSVTPERPRLDVVETYLLLASYASCLNRRHTSITLASTAVRTCIILGLHLEMDAQQLPDSLLREHRRQLWWTAYRCDRMWASKIGWPPSVPDESIEIGLPEQGVLSNRHGDLLDPAYSVASVKLAGLLNYAILTLYVRRRHTTSFTDRVQSAIRSLREWSDTLPGHLRLNTDDLPGTVSEGLYYLHLAFNQAVIVITRPVLLHLLKQRRNIQLDTMAVPSDAGLSLATGCIRRGRQSMAMLKKAWTEGVFQTFDYFFAQFLFSAAIVLGLSTLLREGDWQEDRNDFLLAQSFLHQLEANGNFGAKEFCTHIDAIELLLKEELREHARFSRAVLRERGHQETIVSDSPTDQTVPDLLDATDLDFDADGTLFDWQDLFLPEMLPSSVDLG